MRKPLFSLVIAATAVVAVLSGCGASSSGSTPVAHTSGGSGSASNAGSACITDYNASTDYFPNKAQLSDAKNFTVSYHKSYKVVTVKQPDPTSKAASYVLVQCGAPTPSLTGALSGAQVVTVPVKRVDLSASTQVAAFKALGQFDTVVGINDSASITDDDAIAAVKAGTIATFGTADGGYDAEKIVASKPDLVFEGGFASPTWTKLHELKIPTAAEGGWLETTPLGRAEWIKYYGLFLDQEAKAATYYDQVKTAYQQVAQKAASASGKPSVLVGTEYKGTWTVPGAHSYMAAFVQDAGGSYVFSNVADVSKLDTEAVLAKGATAKIWLNGNWMSLTRWKNKADMLAADPRVSVFQAVKDGQVWNPTKRIASNGSNDFWESGSLRPDLVLGDLAAVMHPDLFSGHTFYYYAKLPA